MVSTFSMPYGACLPPEKITKITKCSLLLTYVHMCQPRQKSRAREKNTHPATQQFFMSKPSTSFLTWGKESSHGRVHVGASSSQCPWPHWESIHSAHVDLTMPFWGFSGQCISWDKMKQGVLDSTLNTIPQYGAPSKWGTLHPMSSWYLCKCTP
jgi:hypothetical protein